MGRPLAVRPAIRFLLFLPLAMLSYFFLALELGAMLTFTRMIVRQQGMSSWM